jgi:hypothetical protein
MKTSRFAIITHLILVAFATSASVAGAQSSTTTTGSTTTTTSTTSSPATATNPTNKLVDSYTDLAGSRENASSLVNGLRTGSSITLTDPSVPPGSSAPTTFSPGTKPMGYGNVRIALSLARTQLASQGIANPTPTELQGALVGTSGTTGTSSQGVLQMRASGMGWGEIANSMGVKLGAVMSGRQTFPATTSTTSTTTTTTAGTTTGKSTTTAAGTSTTQGNGSTMSQQHAKSGIVTATGTSAGAANASHGKSGITTAAGGNAGGGSGGVTTGLGSGGGGGNVSSGAVNASGGRAGGAAGSNAGGQGRGKP